MTNVPHMGARRLFRAALLANVAFGGLAALTGTAHAEEEQGARAEPVIIVTARKQEETLQEVPVTITSVGGGTIEDYNINDVSGVVTRVPTLNVQVGGSGSGGQISLRGVGSSNISASFDSAVAFDFDGVQVSTMRMVQAGFFDTRQIDVLKGPQSLFFGKSASAGSSRSGPKIRPSRGKSAARHPTSLKRRVTCCRATSRVR